MYDLYVQKTRKKYLNHISNDRFHVMNVFIVRHPLKTQKYHARRQGTLNVNCVHASALIS